VSLSSAARPTQIIDVSLTFGCAAARREANSAQPFMPAASPELPRMLLGELATIVRYRLNIKIVIKNNTLGQKEPARTMLQE
jgi:hypothetical protein